jgi:hypothetical protein
LRTKKKVFDQCQRGRVTGFPMPGPFPDFRQTYWSKRFIDQCNARLAAVRRRLSLAVRIVPNDPFSTP